MKYANQPKRDEAAYITIVEGPPPEFSEVETEWAASLAEGRSPGIVAMCETRTLNGEALVQRCRRAWKERRFARLDFPQPDGERAELEIIAVRWEQGPEGHKLILWVKMEGVGEAEENDLER